MGFERDSMKSIIFGAGCVGSCLAYSLKENNYNILFIEKSEKNVEELRKKEKIIIEVLNPDSSNKLELNNFVVKELDSLVKGDINKDDIIFTAVGPKNVKSVRDLLKKLNKNNKVFLCENRLYKTEENVIPVISDLISYKKGNLVKTTPFKFYLPETISLYLNNEYFEKIRNFTSFFYQRLYTHNMLHAVASYVGHIKGYSTISEVIKDKEILKIMESALKEASIGISKEYNIPIKKQREYAKKELELLKIPGLNDPIKRVARDPIRKLKYNDRIVWPLKLCLKAGRFPYALSYTIACLLKYKDPKDSEANKLNKEIEEREVDKVLEEYGRITNKKVKDKIINYYNNLNKS